MARKPSSSHTAEAPILPSGGCVDFNALNDALAAGVPAAEAVSAATVLLARDPANPVEPGTITELSGDGSGDPLPDAD